MKNLFNMPAAHPFAELILLFYLKYNISIIMYLLLQQCISGGHESGFYGSFKDYIYAHTCSMIDPSQFCLLMTGFTLHHQPSEIQSAALSKQIKILELHINGLQETAVIRDL